MKDSMRIFMLAVMIALTGCAANRSTNGVNRPSEAQVRRRLAEVPVLRDAGAQVRDVRFSKDGQNILVLLDLPADSKAASELHLTDDGFNRYKGTFFVEKHDPPTSGASLRDVISSPRSIAKPIIIDFGK